MTSPSLYLIPCLLGGDDVGAALPPRTIETTRSLRHFVVENAKSARAFLKRLDMPLPLAELYLRELNEHTAPDCIADLLAPLTEGHSLGLISEAGCPAVADPGAQLVAAAHAAGWHVAPLVGPSAILLGLMASGLNGQSFSFHGYLPAKPEPRLAALRRLDEAAWRTGATQGFIETPYRNLAMMAAIGEACRRETRVSVAADLSLPTEMVRTQSVAQWAAANIAALDRRPAVFFLGRPL
ncbi:MAG: SAM-dependent methyltransferase [Burkholderiales bacterium]|nr:MAG: SAM-dependent methyltransferase [Burkholderiales bacterium]CAG1009115.1 Ribosomal RNA small subunit methyltransferase I [Myxococcaceae bacterium]